MNGKPLSQRAFIVLVATLFSTVAFSIDAMLPALPDIAANLTPLAPNRAQLIITSFVLGMGIGTFFAGPLSDALGRRKVIIGGLVLYAIGAAVAATANSIEVLLAARIAQGLGAAGPRVATLAMVRDLYSGTPMARIMSLAMMVFVLVPAIAPAIGQVIIIGFGWRLIFYAFIGFAVVAGGWFFLRQPETLAPRNRRALTGASLRAAMIDVMTNRIVMVSIASQTLTFGFLFGAISSIQPIFDVTYGMGDSFPAWFAGMALLSGSASYINARLVLRVGMRRIIRAAFFAEAIVALITVIALATFGVIPFSAFYLFIVSTFFILGFTIGNLNALAMEPMGHIAGFASSIIGAISTVLAVAIAAPIGLAFDGTPLPLAIGVFLCTGAGFGLMLYLGPREPLEELPAG